MDTFTKAYIECALWTECFDEKSASDLDEHTKNQMALDCANFQKRAGDLITDSDQAGHDFWLTRNGHGAGFWDGDWPEEDGKKLTKLAHEFKQYDIYEGDDGKIYGG